VRIELPPDPPDGMIWELQPDFETWLLMPDDDANESPTRSEHSLEGAAVNGLTPVGQEASSG
jgi:hypothetical protein